MYWLGYCVADMVQLWFSHAESDGDCVSKQGGHRGMSLILLRLLSHIEHKTVHNGYS